MALSTDVRAAAGNAFHTSTKTLMMLSHCCRVKKIKQDNMNRRVKLNVNVNFGRVVKLNVNRDAFSKVKHIDAL